MLHHTQGCHVLGQHTKLKRENQGPPRHIGGSHVVVADEMEDGFQGILMSYFTELFPFWESHNRITPSTQPKASKDPCEKNS